MRRTTKLLIGMLVLAAGVLVAAPAAQAADPIYSYKNQASGGCLLDSNVRGLTTDNACYTWYDDYRWAVHQWADGTVRLGNVGTGRCISDRNWGFAVSDACNSSENQSWWVVYWADGTRRFQNQATRLCLDRYTNLSQCDASTSQSWYRL